MKAPTDEAKRIPVKCPDKQVFEVESTDRTTLAMQQKTTSSNPVSKLPTQFSTQHAPLIRIDKTPPKSPKININSTNIEPRTTRHSFKTSPSPEVLR